MGKLSRKRLKRYSEMKVTKPKGKKTKQVDDYIWGEQLSRQC